MPDEIDVADWWRKYQEWDCLPVESAEGQMRAAALACAVPHLLAMIEAAEAERDAALARVRELEGANEGLRKAAALRARDRAEAERDALKETLGRVREFARKQVRSGGSQPLSAHGAALLAILDEPAEREGRW